MLGLCLLYKFVQHLLSLLTRSSLTRKAGFALPLTVCALLAAAHHSSLLLCTCMLALLAPVLALQIENLTRLKANQSEILNLHSDGHHDGMCFLSYTPERCSSEH